MDQWSFSQRRQRKTFFSSQPWTNVSMFVHRLRQWPNIKSTFRVITEKDEARCRCLPCCFDSRRISREIYLPSQYWDIVSMLCAGARHLTLKCFTWKWVPGSTEMAMCMISSTRRNGCMPVCFPWSWEVTQMSRSSDQGLKMLKSIENTWSDYKSAPLPFFSLFDARFIYRSRLHSWNYFTCCQGMSGD